MRAGLIAAAGLLVAASHADALPNADACSAAMTAQWRDATAAHQIDSSKHIPVVLINVPLLGLPSRHQDAFRELTHSFPSFEESPGSGLLTGCCAFPVFGSISFDDLAKLSAAGFAPLCEVGGRALSTHVQVRIEYRESYEQGVGTAPYLWISY